MEAGNNYIEELLERFFEGKTSIAEEKELYSFFTGEDVPEKLLPYKQVFAYFENQLEQELADKDKTEEMLPPMPKAKHSIARKWIITLASAAAIALIIASVSSLFHKPFDPYEGSYIVRNGVKIVDVKQIKAEYRSIEAEMEEKEFEIEQMLQPLGAEYDEY
ncbi:hypothetical protein [Dysgonomonas sp. 25]|uniref:hypothetical protein n=1 Tax=Dysgonomonas sp. 25 TaxID=2302933 RepID=UPI0013D5A435|nr:hypothetical protein [Dysgonomonas sp. 25]NDV69265.1 hypothetical protein [Dysgonomonas sp. 25]